MEFLTNLSEQLEDKLSDYNVVVKLEPFIPRISNGHFVIKVYGCTRLLGHIG
jgi:hypothetical protein